MPFLAKTGIMGGKGNKKMNDFINDLDDYFCKNYLNQTRLAAIAGFVQPVLGEEADPFDAEPYKLCHQKRAKELLATFKEGLIDRDFSFSFAEVPFLTYLKDKRRASAFCNMLPSAFRKYSLDTDNFFRDLSVSEEVWKKIVKGRYYPSKNLILAIALVGGISEKDTRVLLSSCEYEMDFESVRDTVVSYLLTYGVYNESLVREALDEYKITCLPLKGA